MRRKTTAVIITAALMMAMTTNSFAANVKTAVLPKVTQTAVENHKVTKASSNQVKTEEEKKFEELKEDYEDEEYLNVSALQAKINAIQDSTLKKSLNKLLKAYSKALKAEQKELAKSSPSSTKLATLHQKVMNARNQLVNALKQGNISATPYTQVPA